jgi:hypothetical protein
MTIRDLDVATLIGLLAGGALLVILFGNHLDRRATRQRARAATDELLGGATPEAHTPRALTAAVIAAALFGAIASGYAMAGRNDTAEANRAGAASANLARCQDAVATGWRRGIAVLIVGYATEPGAPDELPAELADIATELDLPNPLAGIREEGRRRIIAALADDARLADVTDRICPYTPGDPDATPDEPIRSATEALEDELAAEVEATTTTAPGGD